MSKRPKPLTTDAAAAFVQLMSEGHTHTAAAKQLGYHRTAFNRLAERDEEFRSALADAVEDGTQSLIEEARRRAADGWDEPVFRNGLEVGVVRKYDSTLLMFLIKQRDPSFRENARLEIGGPGGQLLEVKVKHDYGELLDGLEQIGLIRRGPAAAVDAAADGGAERPALLPARAD